MTGKNAAPRKKSYAIVPAILAILLNVGCGGVPTPRLSIASGVVVHAGQSYQFSASVSGDPSGAAIIWSIAATTGQSRTVGTISKTGVYSAPAELPSPTAVEVVAQISGDQEARATSQVRLLPAPPSVSAASPGEIPNSGGAVEVSGANFLPQTQAYVNGAPTQIEYLTPSSAVIAAYPLPGDDQASITVENPWDNAVSAALSIPVESGPTDPDPNSPPSVSSPGYLLGCANPNTGSTTNDWGTGSDPVYVSPSSLTLGTPAYATNTIFWVSAEAAPGQSVLVTGAFTTDAKTVRIAAIPSKATNWQAVVTSDGVAVAAHQQSPSALYFTVPANLAPGVYGFEIDDPSAPPVLGLANLPSIDWVIGGPAVQSAAGALQQRVYDCGAEPGETLQIFGKNFTASDQVSLIDEQGAVTPLEIAHQDTDSISVAVPSAVSPGQYEIFVGADADPALDAERTIFIYPALAHRVVRSVCTGMVADGKTDNSPMLQSCLDADAPGPGSGALAYISMPAGSFVLGGPLRLHSGEMLVGYGADSSKLICEPSSDPPAFWIEMAQFSGVANLSISAPANPYIIRTAASDGSPADSGYVYLTGLQVEATQDLTSGDEQAVFLTGPDIQIYDSTFTNGSFRNLELSYADGAIISGNEFVINGASMVIEDSQDVVFEGNTVRTESPSASGPPTGGLTVGRANCQFGPSALSQNVYVGYNQFEDTSSPGQQVLVNDGDGGSYYGPVESSTLRSLVLADPPAWNWMGTSNPRASMITVVSGTGVGEYSLIASYSGRTVDLLWPWKVVPDKTSIVAITQYERNMTFAHNTFSNTQGASIVLSDAVGGMIEDNVLSNSGTGILVSAFGPYGGPAAYGPVLDTDVLDNTISTGRGDLIQESADTNIAGIGISDMPGVLLSGLLVRGNVVTPENTIYVTDGWNQLTGALVEGNDANLDLAPYGVIQGISVLNNVGQ